MNLILGIRGLEYDWDEELSLNKGQIEEQVKKEQTNKKYTETVY